MARVLFSVSPADPLPIFRQLVEQVKAALATGVLATGDRLPSHRDLAGELVVAPLTVKRAYDLLEREGWIETRRGLGTFVASGGGTPEARADLEVRLGGLVRQARALGLDEDELMEHVRRAWRDRRRDGGRS